MARPSPLHFTDRDKRVMTELLDGVEPSEIAASIGITDEQLRATVRHLHFQLTFWLQVTRGPPRGDSP